MFYCEEGWRQPGCRYRRCSRRRVPAVGSIWGGMVHTGGREWKLHSCIVQGQQHLLFPVCLGKPRLASNCDQAKVSVATQGNLSSTIKLLQLWSVNAASEKQVNIPSTHSILLILICCNLSVLSYRWYVGFWGYPAFPGFGFVWGFFTLFLFGKGIHDALQIFYVCVSLLFQNLLHIQFKFHCKM